MLLTITTTCNPATDLGFLLHKNPARVQEFMMNFGRVHVFYPEAGPERCSASMLLDIDPIDIVRGRIGSTQSGLLSQYVNDRPYAASSFLSVAIAHVYGSALLGKCAQKPELTGREIPLTAEIAALPSRGGKRFIHRLFEPLGYRVQTKERLLDGRFEEWGVSPYYGVTLEKTTTLKDLLTHLYVLVPVLDNQKHYFISEDEVEKLLKKGEGWLAAHPEKDYIAARYLKYRRSLARLALARLAEESAAENGDESPEANPLEVDCEPEIKLNEARLGSVLAALKASGAKRVLDVGCGSGNLLGMLLKETQFELITGMDVSVRMLERAASRLRLDRLPRLKRERIQLIHGSLMYRDGRLNGYDAAAVVEVIEHLDSPRLASFERVLFEYARPETVVLTTPNREYNVHYEQVGEGNLRHRDHRFEWTRAEFESWTSSVRERFGYRPRILGIGPADPEAGPPTQMAVFEK